MREKNTRRSGEEFLVKRIFPAGFSKSVCAKALKERKQEEQQERSLRNARGDF